MLNEKIKVTVIVTIHNSEKYLEECLDSVCSQSLKEIEILCVDGGSIDSSPYILKKYMEKDCRIKIINDSNTSYGHKINIGIANAHGDYISILESDDKMDSLMLEHLYVVAEKFFPDIVDADSLAFFENRGKIYSYKRKKYGDIECSNRIIYNSERKFPIISPGAIWTGIYKKSFLIENKIILNESPGASYQDSSFAFLTSILAETFYHIEEPLYKYRIDNIGSSVKDNSKIFEIIEECYFLENELKKHQITNLNIWNLFYKKKYDVYFWNACRLTDINARAKFLEKYKFELEEDFKKNNISRENIKKEEYITTYMYLDNEQEFLREIEKNSENDLFCKIDYLLREISNKQIVIFGAGIRGDRFIEIIGENHCDIKAICDNDKKLHYTQKHGYEILPVEKAIEKNVSAIFVIANKKNSDAMKKQLLSLGIKEEDILFY